MSLLEMYPFSHYMIPDAFGRKINLNKVKLKALTLGGLLPDIDVITIIFGIDFVHYFHGTYTHSFVIAFLLAFIVGIIFFICYRKNVFIYLTLGVFMHIIIDFVNLFLPIPEIPNRMILLYPFSNKKFDLTHIISNSIIIYFIFASIIFAISLYLFIKFIKQKEYPWRIWIDERKIIKAIRNYKK